MHTNDLLIYMTPTIYNMAPVLFLQQNIYWWNKREKKL